MAIPIISCRALVRVAILGICLAALVAIGWFFMIRMPGKSWSGPLPPLGESEANLAAELQQDVSFLGSEIGERNILQRYEALQAAARFIETALSESGYPVETQGFEVRGKSCRNLSAEKRGQVLPKEIVVVGAHYDTVIGSPGANDNGTGVAAALSLARTFKERASDRTVRFVFFTNEEPPFYQTESMGSLVYARACRQRRENVVAMLSLETIGYFSDAAGSQKYPPPLGFFYPSQGNFIAFVGNVGSRKLVRKTLNSFRKHACFPSEGASLPGVLPGIGWSDHWSFWKAGYQAVMVTDTAPYRYLHYHLGSDTPDKVDFDRMARVVAGLEGVVTDLAGAE